MGQSADKNIYIYIEWIDAPDKTGRIACFFNHWIRPIGYIKPVVVTDSNHEATVWLWSTIAFAITMNESAGVEINQEDAQKALMENMAFMLPGLDKEYRACGVEKYDDLDVLRPN